MSTLHLSGSPIEYLELGSGEPVVLLHSSASSGAQWHALAERLATRYRVIAPDLYGYGGSAPWSGKRPFSLECEAKIVVALLGSVGGRAHLVGHSYGGAVALRVAATRGERLHSLTLIEPAAFHLLRGAETAALAEIVDVAERVAYAVARNRYDDGIERFVDYWSGPGTWAAVPKNKRVGLAARLPKIALDFHAAFNEPIRLEDLRSMTVPTLLLKGTRSPFPTRRICERLAHVLPDASLKTIAEAGHMAPITHRDEVNALVIDQIQSRRAARRPSARHCGIQPQPPVSPAAAMVA